MPIKPENKGRYPKNWKEIRKQILQRANNRCEFCGRENHSMAENEQGKMIKVVLTIAHLNHTPEDCRPENLRALCQRCHNRYDAKHRAETRKNNKKQKKWNKTQTKWQQTPMTSTIGSTSVTSSSTPASSSFSGR